MGSPAGLLYGPFGILTRFSLDVIDLLHDPFGPLHGSGNHLVGSRTSLRPAEQIVSRIDPDVALTVRFTLPSLTVAHGRVRIPGYTTVTQSESGTKVNSVPQRGTLGEVNIRRLVLRQFNQFAAVIGLGKNFAVKHESPPSCCLGVEPKIFDCFVAFYSQRNAYLFAPFVRGKTLV